MKDYSSMDFYTIWSDTLFVFTLVLILIDLFVDYLPGWFIAYVFANTITVGIVGTLILTTNIEALYKNHYRSVQDYAIIQFTLHFLPMVIAFYLLLFFPDILKPFKLWPVIVSAVVFAIVYMLVPSSLGNNIGIAKVREVYEEPSIPLLLVTFIGILALTIFAEHRLIELYMSS
jgi:glucan phosphoethanolaminetransferase (alkaline phosphatase superfamily)